MYGVICLIRIILQVMDVFSDQEDGPQINLNRSCNQKIENDPLNGASSDSVEVRLTKSEKEDKEIDQQRLLQEMKKNWKPKQLNQSEGQTSKQQLTRPHIPIQIDKERRLKPDFGTELVVSESVSIDEEFIARLESTEQKGKLLKCRSQNHKSYQSRQIMTTQRTSWLNIVLVGKSGIGKTSFMDSFCNRKNESITPCRQRTEKLTIRKYDYCHENHTTNIEFIDIPGFQEINIQDYIKEVEQMINDRFQMRYSTSKDQLNGKEGILSKYVRDNRIHCCIFFISGPWINQCQWLIMKRLQLLVNVIPVVAKGDTFTTVELKQFKKKIHEKNRIQNINWFSIEEILRQKHRNKLERLLNGTFGKSPPFVIICGTEKVYNERTKKSELTREYRWGQIELNSDENNDFRFLKELLTEYIGDVLVTYTDVFEKRFLEMKPKDNVEFLLSSNSDLNPMNINRSHNSDASRQDILQNYESSFLGNWLPIGLTLLGLATFMLIQNKQSK